MPDEAYTQGHIDGEIAARLANHDKHFETINGSIAKTATELHGLLLAVQRLSDQFDNAAKTAITTAAALKAADEARRAQGEQRWSPVQKLIALIGAAAALIAAVVAIRALTR